MRKKGTYWTFSTLSERDASSAEGDDLCYVLEDRRIYRYDANEGVWKYENDLFRIGKFEGRSGTGIVLDEFEVEPNQGMIVTTEVVGYAGDTGDFYSINIRHLIMRDSGGNLSALGAASNTMKQTQGAGSTWIAYTSLTLTTFRINVNFNATAPVKWTSLTRIAAT